MDHDGEVGVEEHEETPGGGKLRIDSFRFNFNLAGTGNNHHIREGMLLLNWNSLKR